MKNNIIVKDFNVLWVEREGFHYSFNVNRSLKGLPTDYLQRVIADAIDKVVEANKPRLPKNPPGKPEDYKQFG